MENKSICEIVRDTEQNYTTGIVKRGKHVNFSMYNTVEKIIAYYNSTHTTGAKDSLGRDKPFFNIGTAAVNIWYRATDIDRKDINVMATKDSSVLQALLATIFLRDWMRRAHFGQFLNKWGRVLAKFGSAVVKFVEKDGKLICTVVPWRNILCDPSDWEATPVIEKFYVTPAQLRKNTAYDKKVVEQLIESAQSTRKNLDETTQDHLSGFIELYEITGELPKALLLNKPEKNDWNSYVLQKHVVSFNKTENDEFDDYSLYKSTISKNPYMLTHLIEEDDRVLGMGAIEVLFESQWMINHSVKNMKDTLDLASMLILQTADGNFVNQNVLSNMQTGEIMLHQPNKPLTRVDNSKPDIASLQNYANMWQILGREVSATPEATRGITPPSGTPYSSVALLTNQSLSLFEIMVENKALHLENMLREYIIPHIKKKMANKDTVMATLEDWQIKMVDSKFIPAQSAKSYNERVKNEVLSGKIAEPYDGQEETAIRSDLDLLGSKRPFTPNKEWKDELKDLEWEFEINISGESMDKSVMLQTLTTLFQTIVQATKDPSNAEAILNKILNITGVMSPIELKSGGSVPPQSGAVGTQGGGQAQLQELTAQK